MKVGTGCGEMSELAERAKKLAASLTYWLIEDTDERMEHNAGVIEQALLAERRLAMEAVSKRIEAAADQHAKASVEYRILHYAAKDILQETKLATPRGGE